MSRNGFTLVEMMIVMAVAALLAGVVVMTVPSDPGPKHAAARFASRMAAARDQAVLTGRPISAWVSSTGYGFDQLRDGRWERLEQKPFEGDDWGRGMHVGLKRASPSRARVRVDSLGVADQALALHLNRAGKSAGVRIATSGEVTVE